MQKVAALKKIKDTYSQTVAQWKTKEILLNQKFANFGILQSFNYRNEGEVNLLSKKILSFCENCDLMTNKIDAVWCIVYFECFPLPVTSVYRQPKSETQAKILPKKFRKASDCRKTNKLRGCMVFGDQMLGKQFDKMPKSTNMDKCLTFF